VPTDPEAGSKASFPLRGTMWEISRAIRGLPQPACSGLEQRIERLEAELELRDLQVQYIHALDSSDIDLIMTFFAANAVLLNPRGTFVGRHAIRTDYDYVLARTRMRFHFATNVASRVLSGGHEAWTMAHNYAVVVSGEGAITAGAGTTAERLVRSDSGWVIAERRVTTNVGHVLTAGAFRLGGASPQPTSAVTSHELIGMEHVL
jgi:SnoaL-like domain